MRSMAHYAEWVTMSGGRHRGPGVAIRGRAAVVTMILVAGIGALAVWRSMGPSSCSGELQLTVAATPEIAPALQDAADSWATGASAPGGECIAVDVTSVAP